MTTHRQIPPFGPLVPDGGPGDGRARRGPASRPSLTSLQAAFFGLFLVVYLAACAGTRGGRAVVIDAGGDGGSGGRTREFDSEFEERVYRTAPPGQFDGYEGGREGRAVRIGRVAGPDGEGGDGDEGGGGLYTGVAHFRHGNDPNLATFVLSSNGGGTYLTVDLSEDRPFEGAKERRVDGTTDGTVGGGSSWVSTHTRQNDDGTYRHYALFSGGHRSEKKEGEDGRSALYVADELPDGTLGGFALDWTEDPSVQPAGARSCTVADLGDLRDLGDGRPVSERGSPDLIVTGRGGLDVYSSSPDGGGWRRVRSLPMSDLHTDAAALYGTAVVGGRYVVAASRPGARYAGRGHESPAFVYDAAEGRVVQRLAVRGVSSSVAVLDGGSRVIVGSGAKARLSGQPNIVYEMRDRGDDAPLLEVAGSQLLPDMPLRYNYPFARVDGSPDGSRPVPGATKTRQVRAFRAGEDGAGGADVVLEVNAAQTCNVYYRPEAGGPATKVLQLPGSEGYVVGGRGRRRRQVVARAGDAVVSPDGGTVHVVLANHRGRTTVYSFGREHLSSTGGERKGTDRAVEGAVS